MFKFSVFFYLNKYYFIIFINESWKNNTFKPLFFLINFYEIFYDDFILSDPQQQIFRSSKVHFTGFSDPQKV